MMGTPSFLLAVLLVGTLVSDGGNAQETAAGLRGLVWCSTTCLCRSETREKAVCFERDQMFELLNISGTRAIQLKRLNWDLEAHVFWCSDLCLCYKRKPGDEDGPEREFRCVKQDDVVNLLRDSWEEAHLLPALEKSEAQDGDDIQPKEHNQQEEEAPHGKHRSKTRHRNKKHRKHHSDVHHGRGLEPVVEDTRILDTPSSHGHHGHHHRKPEHGGMLPSPGTTSQYPVVTLHPRHEDDIEVIRDHTRPKQEAVAASPAVIAQQPPTHKQPSQGASYPYGPSAASAAASTSPNNAIPNSETENDTPKVSPVIEVPLQHKTVATEVSKDLKEIENEVLLIRSSVTLNQRLLIVVIAVAGVAMLGVLILAVLICHRRRANKKAEDPKPREKGGPKESNHVTKVNLEEAW